MGNLRFANRPYVDEAVLTGESMPVNKVKDNDVFVGNDRFLRASSYAVEARSDNEDGGNYGEIQEVEEDTQFQRQLKGFSNQLVVVIGY